jgi:exodeoxyribonuclease V gamma subunit
MIAILGLNDGDFPKIDRHPSFDLMGLAGQFRQGDRSARRDDRYQFLDALLSARQSLYLSYIGQSIRTNEELAPSVVLSELLDVLELQPVKHPLHSFSQGYFAQNSQLATYQAKAAKVAQAFAQSQRFQRAPRWWQGAIDQPNKIAQATDAQQPGLLIEELIRFARDPQLYFMQTVIGIRYDEIEQQQTASEPFELNGLENYDLNQRLLEAKLKGDAELQQLVTRIQHTGEWLSGSFGDMKLAEQLSGFDPFVEQIQEILNQRATSGLAKTPCKRPNTLPLRTAQTQRLSAGLVVAFDG